MGLTCPSSGPQYLHRLLPVTFFERQTALVEGPAWRLAASVLARAAKADRLRQAKQEAEREVKAYKAQREEQYQKRIADVRGPLAGGA